MVGVTGGTPNIVHLGEKLKGGNVFNFELRAGLVCRKNVGDESYFLCAPADKCVMNLRPLSKCVFLPFCGVLLIIEWFIFLVSRFIHSI